jgi:hypothetical protein
MLKMPLYHPVIEEALQDALHELVKGLDVSVPATSKPGGFFPWRRRAVAAT